MELSKSEKQYIWDYVFFHYHSPLNTNPDDYRRFNFLMFRAVKMNFLYTTAFGVFSYQFLIGKNGVMKGYSSPGYIALVIGIFSVSQYFFRLRQSVYSEEALQLSQKYKKDIQRWNDHYRRLYGNQ